MKMTKRQRDARIKRRAKAKATAAKKVQTLRDWHTARRIDAQKRHAAWEKGQQKARATHRKRVQKNLPQVGKLKPVDPLPAPVGVLGTSTLPDGRTITANYASRRAMGARGKPRPLRVREMPGAKARRYTREAAQ